MQENNNNIIISLLISPRLRIIRHIILFALLLSISAGFIWFMQEKEQLTGMVEIYGGLLFFSFLFLAGCYLNIYVLTPKLLLRNRSITYICLLLCVVVFIIAAIMVVQTSFPEVDIDIDNLNYLTFAINLLSTTIAIFLLFVGTTTLVLFKYWILDMQQAEELESATLQLELKLLENQINPHFLFNMLNNANIMITKEPDTAIHIIAKLEDMLRYQMDESTREYVYLKEEIDFLNDFLELEKTRRDYFNYTISIDGEPDRIQIPPLLFITFVENAVKHNQDSQASFVHIAFEIKEGKLIFTCENSIPQRPQNKQVGGIGLANIRRRLNLLYKNNYSLEHTKTETDYMVRSELKL